MKKTVTLLLLLSFTFLVRADIPPADKLLPADTLFFMTVPDFSAMRAESHQSSQWMLWNDPAMKPFHDKFMDKWNQTIVAPLEQDLGVKLSDFYNLPQGQITFAVTQNGWTGGDDQRLGILFLLDSKTNSSLLKTNLAKLTQKWKDDGKPIHTETVRGISFSIVPLSSNDIPVTLSSLFTGRQPSQDFGQDQNTNKPGELVIGQFDSLLIVGNSLKAVDPVVAHLTGSLLPALSDDSGYAADKVSKFHDQPLYLGWLNARTLFNVISHIPSDQPNPNEPAIMSRPPANKVISILGLEPVKSASFSYYDTREGSQLNISIAAPESSRQVLLKIFAAEPKTTSPPSFVPSDVLKYWRWRLDSQGDWDELQKMVGNISPAALSAVNAAIEMANANAQRTDPSFDFRKSLIQNLGDDFISYQKASGATGSGDLNSATSVFLFAVQDSDRTVIAINELLSMGKDNPDATREFLGHKIYTIPLPGTRNPAGGNAMRSFYCTASGGYIAMSSDVSLIMDYLRSTQKPPKPLSSIPGLVNAAQHVGGENSGLFGYENHRDTMRLFFKLVKSSTSPDNLGSSSPMASLPKSIRDWMDFSLLPDYDQVSKYFYFSVYGGGATPDGLEFKVFAPRPPDLN